MSTSFRFLLPFGHTLPEAECYFRGYIKSNEDSVTTIYITKYSKSFKIFEEIYENKYDVILGCSTQDLWDKSNFDKFNNCFLICNKIYPEIQYLKVNGKQVGINNIYIIISYNFIAIKNSETLSEDNDYISELQTLLQNDNREKHSTETNTVTEKNTNYKSTFTNPSWLISSMFIQHLYNYLNMIMWLISSIKRNKKVLMKEGNLIFSLVVDIILGYLILELLLKEKKDLPVLLMGILEKLVNLMYSLLKWLMGSPAGLKLNNAFNKMLGKYFSYHIELWWLFLDVSGEKLDVIFHLYKYIGYLGFTFQAAIVADLISIATFHSYCIYVYAARLFNIQISGLIALLRLFVGRKYNPLRGGIDSCEYTNQELFVGTVAFTILLLLLPTTVMYYTVFTLFRVLSMLVQYILAKCIYWVQTVPIYVIFLWLTNSTRIAGNVLIEVVRNDDSSLLWLQIKLFNKSLRDLIYNFRPPVEVSKHVEWGNVVSNVITGKQII